MLNNFKGVGMFVSSYSTYVSASTSDKTLKSREEGSQEKTKPFGSKITDASISKASLSSSVPLNYISDEQTQHTKRMMSLQGKELEEKSKNEFKKTNEALTRFNSSATMQSANAAYSSNSTTYSLFKKVNSTINQTPRINSLEGKDVKEIKEQNMRDTMVNTYLANDKYYQVTA